jgi:hypothetical protein
MTRSGPTAPDYGRGVHRLLPDAVDAILGKPDGMVPLPDRPRALAVIVVDGLGRDLLAAHRALAPGLAGAPGTTLHAPYSSTTATSLAGIGTGRPPGEHGIVGYSMRVPGDRRPLLALTWSWEVHDPALAVTDEIVPEELQPLPTAFDLAREAGVRPVSVLREEFVASGLTRAGLRGGDVMTATGLEATLEAVGTALSSPGESVVYAHHGDLDTIGHLVGPGAADWLDELARIDAAVTALAAQLPADVALVVTADHGMVRVPEQGFVELTDHPGLLDGVTTLTGDPRARQLHAEPGAASEVLAAWRDHCGERAHVLTRDEAIAAGWFGPRVLDRVRPRIGDVVVSARDLAVAWVHAGADLFGGRMPGMHGAVTAQEIEVPAAVLAGPRTTTGRIP